MKTVQIALGAFSLAALAPPAFAQVDPRITSWLTTYSGQYARIYTSDAAKSSGAASNTWSRGAGVQSLPTYSGVSQIAYSADWVYVRNTGLGSHVMGPWYLNAAHTQNFPNFPANTANLYRIPRAPTVPGTKTLTGLGAIGIFVDGVAMFDNRDAFSYVNASATDATPMNMLVGDGIWNRDAYVNENVTFDPGNAHQAGKVYHYHANPPALRYLLGDHVDYSTGTKAYSESAAAVTKHSPIIGWVRDGYPIYGPYGYSVSNDASSGVRRMISGYIKRDGSNGTTNLNTTGRTTLPAWAALAQGRSAILAANQYGPTVSATYTLGHYLEDYDYLGDLGYTQGTNTFDLDQYNGRVCVTPEFPAGTYAYFVSMESDGTPRFPYNTGRWFYGNPTGTNVASITEAVTTNFSGGTKMPLNASAPDVNVANANVTLTWSSIDGGTYVIEATSDLASWSAIATNAPVTQTNLPAPKVTRSVVETNAAAAASRFYRVRLTATNAYDSGGFAP
ncbi:MAG TPA: YHYH protein [Verrucomicrobiae bacterium]|jgi:hypothetical protein